MSLLLLTPGAPRLYKGVQNPDHRLLRERCGIEPRHPGRSPCSSATNFREMGEKANSAWGEEATRI